jgi:hypothetical protein
LDQRQDLPPERGEVEELAVPLFPVSEFALAIGDRGAALGCRLTTVGGVSASTPAGDIYRRRYRGGALELFALEVWQAVVCGAVAQPTVRATRTLPDLHAVGGCERPVGVQVALVAALAMKARAIPPTDAAATNRFRCNYILLTPRP